MDIQQNTLYVMTEVAYLRQDHLTIRIEVNRQPRLAVPIHHIDSIALFGRVSISPQLLRACAQAGKQPDAKQKQTKGQTAAESDPAYGFNRGRIIFHFLFSSSRLRPSP